MATAGMYCYIKKPVQSMYPMQSVGMSFLNAQQSVCKVSMGAETHPSSPRAFNPLPQLQQSGATIRCPTDLRLTSTALMQLTPTTPSRQIPHIAKSIANRVGKWKHMQQRNSQWMGGRENTSTAGMYCHIKKPGQSDVSYAECGDVSLECSIVCMQGCNGKLRHNSPLLGSSISCLSCHKMVSLYTFQQT